MPRFRFARVSVFVLAVSLSPHATAAEAYDNCTGFIDALPAVITTQGTWCLRKDLTTNISSGQAIDIRTNNVTLDCNHFKIGNLSAPQPFQAFGVHAADRGNIAIRHCTIRGFFTGTYLVGGFGHLVEDNRVDGARSVGLWVDADQSIVRRNHVTDIGLGGTVGNTSGITAQGDSMLVEGNYISSIVGTPDPEGNARGIVFSGLASLVRGNFITSVLPGAGVAAGIRTANGDDSVIEGNVVVNPNPTAGHGLDVNAGSDRPVCLNNRIRGFTTSAIDTCIDGGGNYSD